ncbi:hypothetical protein N7488_011809 [Penicillium malachiteum]|nr:hypothetical protein N7488_011809 [Penicillium malachiteum]
MATVLPSKMRRSITSIPSKALRASAPHRVSSTALPRGYLSATNRGIASLSSKSGFLVSSSQHNYKPAQQKSGLYSRNQVRWRSDEPGSLREWGFEEINTALPSSSSSDLTHTPVILIDVREPAELKGTGIIPTAISIPLASQPDALYLTPDEFETRFGFPKPVAEDNQKLVFYCKAGVRARAAAQLAVQAGYDAESLGVYDGSWLDWERNGGRVERWDGDDF